MSVKNKKTLLQELRHAFYRTLAIFAVIIAGIGLIVEINIGSSAKSEPQVKSATTAVAVITSEQIAQRNKEELTRQEELKKAFPKIRDQMMADMRKAIKIRRYGNEIMDARKYLPFADAEFTKLYDQENALYQVLLTNNALEQNKQFALRKMDVEREKVAVWTLCKTAVKDSLKAPSTADFPWTMNVSVSPDLEYFTVNSFVDAQNSFGAMIRTTYLCRMKFNGGGLDGWVMDSLSVHQ
jgi:hypothetical protein